METKEIYERMKEMENTMVLTKEDWQVKDKWLGCCYESEYDSHVGKYYE